MKIGSVHYRNLLLLLGLIACQGCGTLWRIPAKQKVAFISRPSGATVEIVNQETRQVYARVTTPAEVEFTSSPWRKRRPYVYLCTYEAAGRMPVQVPLTSVVPNGMHVLWTVGYPIGLLSACFDDLWGSGSCRFPKEMKIRMRTTD